MPTSPCLRIAEDADAEAIAHRLSARDDVVYAQAAYRVHTRLRPNDPRYSAQWNLPAIDMERAWDINPGGSSSTIVAVLDTGVAFRSGVFRYNARSLPHRERPTFPALGPLDITFAARARSRSRRPLRLPARLHLGRRRCRSTSTGTARTSAARSGSRPTTAQGVAGVAFNVKIMPVKVIDGRGTVIFGAPGDGTDETVARGIRYAADNGAKVINMSIGRTGSPAPAVEEAMRYAVSEGRSSSIAGGQHVRRGQRGRRCSRRSRPGQRRGLGRRRRPRPRARAATRRPATTSRSPRRAATPRRAARRPASCSRRSTTIFVFTFAQGPRGTRRRASTSFA